MSVETSFPGNSAALSALVQRLSEGNMSCFAGAGCSAALYPSWSGLAVDLIEKCSALGLAESADQEFWNRLALTAPHDLFSRIKIRMSKPVFLEHIRSTFSRRASLAGQSYTDLVKQLFALPLSGFITTNYDPSILEARIDFRPGARSTGWGTWSDSAILRDWISGAAFRDNECPILHIHGHYDRPDTIILTAEDYHAAYAYSQVGDFYNHILRSLSFLFVGFGFNDYVFKSICERINFRDENPPRHFALVGLAESQEYSREIRSYYSSAFGISPIFYRIKGDQDHSACQEAIIEIASHLRTAATPTSSLKTNQIAWQQVKNIHFEHETTDDDLYTGREQDVERLNKWFDDPTVNAIALIGMGGLGKTSLIGFWLKRCILPRVGSECRGVFFWSFYGNKSLVQFIDVLARFLSISSTLASQVKVDRVLHVLSTKRYVIVVDGLEVLQERPITTRYGSFLDPHLASFLRRLAQRNAGIVVITSRFPISDLSSEIGLGLRTDYVTSLSIREGVDLLQKLSVDVKPFALGAVVEKLSGHPLALKLFARVVTRPKAALSHDVRYLFNRIDLRDDDALERKIAKLLLFYENTISITEKNILCCLAMFSTPVSLEVIYAIYERSFGIRISSSDLISALNTVISDGIVIAESANSMFSTHPIIRLHFRHIGMPLVGSSAVSVLTDAPDLGALVGDVDRITEISDAINILCDMDKFSLADELYVRRLNDGAAIRSFGCYDVGYSASSAFVLTTERREEAAKQLTIRRISFYLNELAIFSSIVGELAIAEHSLDIAYIIDNDIIKDELFSSITMLNLTEISYFEGKVQQAIRNIDSGLKLARKGDYVPQIIDCLAFRLRTCLLLDDFTSVTKDYTELISLWEKIGANGRITQCVDTSVVTFFCKYALHVPSFKRHQPLLNFENEVLAKSCNPIDAPVKLFLNKGICGDLEGVRREVAEVERAKNVKALMQLKLLSAISLFREAPVASEQYYKEVIDQARARDMVLLLAEAYFCRGVDRLVYEIGAPEEAVSDLEFCQQLARQRGVQALTRRVEAVLNSEKSKVADVVETFKSEARSHLEDLEKIRATTVGSFKRASGPN